MLGGFSKVGAILLVLKPVLDRKTNFYQFGQELPYLKLKNSYPLSE